MAAGGGSWKGGKFSAKGGSFVPSAEQKSLRRQLVDAIEDHRASRRSGSVFAGDDGTAERIATLRQKLRATDDDFADDVGLATQRARVNFDQPTNSRRQARLDTFKRLGWTRDGS